MSAQLDNLTDVKLDQAMYLIYSVKATLDSMAVDKELAGKVADAAKSASRKQSGVIILLLGYENDTAKPKDKAVS